jgi:dUTP pyrophosphatase
MGGYESKRYNVLNTDGSFYEVESQTTQNEAIKSVYDRLDTISDPVGYTLEITRKIKIKNHELRVKYNKRINLNKLVFSPLVMTDLSEPYNPLYIYWSGVNLTKLLLNTPGNSRLIDNSVSYTSTTNYKLTHKDAIPPTKERHTDAGFDLNLVHLNKSSNGVDYYTTGVCIEPSHMMWYMLVPRSSMAKSGFEMCNGVGIIDSEYRGEIIVAVRKTRDDAVMTLPFRCVQLIPQIWYNITMKEASILSQTSREDSGGLGSKQFSEVKSVSE